MAMATTAEELGKLLKKGEDYIEIEVPFLKDKVIRIKAVGKVAWAVCFSALAVAITAVIATVASGGIAAPAAVASKLITVPAVALTLGSAATTAISIAVAGGSASILNKLRKYQMTKDGDKIILRKR